MEAALEPVALLHYLQLYLGGVTPGAVRTLYTCPSGYRVVIRNLQVANRASSSFTYTSSVNAARVIDWYLLAAAGDPAASISRDLRCILNPGDFLSFNAPSGSAVDVWATGSIYSI